MYFSCHIKFRPHQSNIAKQVYAQKAPTYARLHGAQKADQADAQDGTDTDRESTADNTEALVHRAIPVRG
jgi:hypothetical protein